MSSFFFFNDTATTEIYTLSLHDALPICQPALAFGQLAVDGGHQVRDHLGVGVGCELDPGRLALGAQRGEVLDDPVVDDRSEEHTSELQSPCNLVCRLLLEKKKDTYTTGN